MHKKPCNLFYRSNVASQCLAQSEKQQHKNIVIVFRFALVASHLFWTRSKALISTTKAGCTNSSATGFCCAVVLRAGCRKAENNSRTALLLFSALRLPRLYFKWGVPQTPENNTKVLLKEVIYLKQTKAWCAASKTVPFYIIPTPYAQCVGRKSAYPRTAHKSYYAKCHYFCLAANVLNGAVAPNPTTRSAP